MTNYFWTKLCLTDVAVLKKYRNFSQKSAIKQQRSI